MITMDELHALMRSEVKVEDEKQVTLVLDPQASAEAAVRGLKNYFGGHEEQRAIRVLRGSEELGYLLRTDLYNLVSVGTRGIGDSDGTTLPGSPRGVTLTELCCPRAGCPQVLVVTDYDENDPPKCGEHGATMELCT